MEFTNYKMHFKITFLILLGLITVLITSCDRETISENIRDNTIQNQFPIEYEGDKILEFNAPYTKPNGQTVNQDTFAIYCITNKSTSVIWVKTVPFMGIENWKGFKDSSIKKIHMNRMLYHLKKEKQWTGSSDGNGCWGGCNDSLKLLPNEKLFFIYGGRDTPNYDSISFAMTVKIKNGFFFKDSIVVKKLIFNKSFFTEDTNYWSSIAKY